MRIHGKWNASPIQKKCQRTWWTWVPGHLADRYNRRVCQSRLSYFIWLCNRRQFLLLRIRKKVGLSSFAEVGMDFKNYCRKICVIEECYSDSGHCSVTINGQWLWIYDGTNSHKQCTKSGIRLEKSNHFRKVFILHRYML